LTFIRAVLAELTWKRFLIAESLGLILVAETWLGLDAADKFSRYMAVESTTLLSSAFFFLLATLCADQWVRRGARPFVAFSLALIPACLLGGFIQTELWFDLAWRRERNIYLFLVENASEVGIWGALAMLVYFNRTKAERMLRGVRQTQLNCVRIERGLIDSRLEAARTQIDAPTLFAELAEIRDSLLRDEAGAAEALDALILRLRNSVAQGHQTPRFSP
jgi:hypothetical protein